MPEEQLAQRLVTELHTRKMLPWTPSEIPPGNPHEKVIRTKIDESDVVIDLFSSARSD